MGNSVALIDFFQLSLFSIANNILHRKFSQFSLSVTAKRVRSINFSFPFTLASATRVAFRNPRPFTQTSLVCRPTMILQVFEKIMHQIQEINLIQNLFQDDLIFVSTFSFSFWSTSEAGWLVIQFFTLRFTRFEFFCPTAAPSHSPKFSTINFPSAIEPSLRLGHLIQAPVGSSSSLHYFQPKFGF